MRELIKLFNKHFWVYLVFAAFVVGFPISRMIKDSRMSFILAMAPMVSLAIIYFVEEFIFKTHDRKVVLRRMSKKEYEKIEEHYKGVYSEFAYLSEMLKKNIEAMGLNRRDYVTPGWLVKFNVILRHYAEKHQGRPYSDLHIASAIMQVLIGHETSLEDVEVIYNAVTPLIKNPKEYKITVTAGRCFLEETGKLSVCDVDEYRNLMGDYYFFKLLKDSALSSYAGYYRTLDLCEILMDIHTFGYVA